MPQDVVRFKLLGRRRETEALDRVLREVRDERSQVLVLRGEAGIGKSALLDYVAAQASELRVLRAAGVESESDFTYSVLERVCAPLMRYLDHLPPHQVNALHVAFGEADGEPPKQLVLGMAVLMLFSFAAADSPSVCLIDDAQWIDRHSRQILMFVARRLDAESAALIFAERVTEAETTLPGLPELAVGALQDADANALLDAALPGPVDARMRDRIIAETRGNPLALMELPRGLSAAELAFGFGGQAGGPLETRVEEGFRRRIEALPADTRTFLLVAAVEPVGDVLLLWRGLERLGIGPEAAEPAEAAGLVTVGAPIRFRHPLVRSAVWRRADPATLRRVHAALAEATDPDSEPDRRAWHLAYATAGPDEQVAAALEGSAGRALTRGGQAAAACFLDRAATLTADPKERARRTLAAAWAQLDAGAPARVPDLLAAAALGPLDPLQQADAARLRGKVSFMMNPGLASVAPLLDAAARLRELDPAAARVTSLMAIGSAMWAGRLDPNAMRRAAERARDLPPGDDVAGLFLRALIAWAFEGPVAAAPALAEALHAFTDSGEFVLLWLASNAAMELGDLDEWSRITENAIAVARTTGSLSILSTALTYRAGAVAYLGRFSEAYELLAEAAATGEAAGLATHQVTKVIAVVYQGRERPALDLIESIERDAEQRGMNRLHGTAGFARAVLYNGLGKYPIAMRAAQHGVEHADLGLHHWAQSELVEAASRAGEQDVAARAREAMAAWSRSATPWSLGARSLADALVGPDDEAEEHYRAAVGHFAGGGLKLFEARAHLLFGEWLRRQNRRAQAREELRTAHEACTDIGMEAFAERARRELLATGETVRRSTVGAPELTPQEAQIARLAANGRSNPEIARELFLSPRTVEWHLRKIFGKFGISSRRELDAALSAR
ncbi:MAG TPA: AAA family ATPase [Actinospica sp.]|nr:AAA family ATPase [Actinospica sp.]